MGNTRVFRENLKRIRKSMGMTQAEMAEKVDISVRGYQKYEQGESVPRPDTMAAIAKALDCTVADLYRPDTPEPPRAPEGTTMADLARGMADLKSLIRNAPVSLTPMDRKVLDAFHDSTPRRRLLALHILTGEESFLDSAGSELRNRLMEVLNELDPNGHSESS